MRELAAASGGADQLPQPRKRIKYPGDILEAADAWASMGGPRVPSDEIAVLKESSKSRVYRLPNASPDGRDIVAKRRKSSTLRTERQLYGGLAQRLGLRLATVFGVVERGDLTWQFMEDLGDVRWDPHDAHHMGLLSDWLAALHRSALGTRMDDAMPTHDLAVYQRHLRDSRPSIGFALSTLKLSEPQRESLIAMSVLLDRVNDMWHGLRSASSAWPPTLVHGDLQSKNIMMINEGLGALPVPVDWETAGWGDAAADVAALSLGEQDDHWALERYCWNRFGSARDLPLAIRWACAGNILRHVAAVDWASLQLSIPEEHLAKPLLYIERYVDRLTNAVTTFAALHD